ncbi:MAG: ABC transporter permease [Acidimicrobiales bacterium]
MNANTVRVALYRFRTTLAQRRGGYLSLVALVALLGGVALGAVAGARQTSSSFVDLVEQTNPSQLYGPVQVYNPHAGFTTGYSASTVERVRQLPHVANVESLIGLNVFPVGPNNKILPGDDGLSPNASINGLFFDQDRLLISTGRLADPLRADEFVADSQTARHFHWHLGQVVTFAYYTDHAELASGNGPPTIAGDFTARLVGTGARQAADLVQDGIDSSGTQIMLFTPALARRFETCCANDTIVAIQVAGGDRYVSAVQREFRRAFNTLHFSLTTANSVEAKASRSITPFAVALGVFGGLAGLAMLVIAAQVIGRLRRLDSDDAVVLRALGADPAMTFVDGTVGAMASVVVGALLAAAVAVALSPLAPIGPARPYLGGHLHADWVVLGLGVALTVVVLGAVTAVLAYRSQPARAARRATRHVPRGSATARVVGQSGLPISAAIGVRFALEPGVGRQRVPVRSAIIGATLALIVVCATVTFGASLHRLVTRPALFGWNWNTEVNGGGGVGDLFPSEVRAVHSDPLVATASNTYFSTLRLNGQVVPVMGLNPGAAIQPPLLSGHDVRSANEVVLGASTLAALHTSVGATITVDNATRPERLRVVGTATLPADGQSGGQHLEMGVGAVLDYSLIPLAARDLFDSTPGPNVILVRFRPGVTPASGDASLRRVVRAANGGHLAAGTIVAVQRPAEIVNYHSLTATPIALGATLAVGALIALALTQLASVRRRRWNVALLKALGFTRRQVMATVAWQSSVAAAIGAVIGVPLGVLLGRTLWDLFANAIHAVPRPIVPVPELVILAVASLVLANLIAVLPARIAARTRPALALRSE